jgi:DNA-binding XRE family transcriptional regulator
MPARRPPPSFPSYPDNKALRPDLPAGMKPHKRPDPRPPLTELIALREQRCPDMLQKDFAKILGITRLHMTAIEQGRRTPSIELALRWIQVLAPEARMEMFGPLPVVEERIRAIKRLRELSPETFEAA